MHARMRADVDRDDRVRLFLVRDDPLASRLDECVVVEVQVPASREVAGVREAPEDVMPGIDEDDPVVAAVGDQERARQR
jgi:hypothetical protein